jgi:hypothetical protein
MTQRDQILQMLTEAGDRGVTSNEFYDAYLPRFPARIHELRADGIKIDDEPEGRFKRYKLSGDASSLGAGGIAVGRPRQEPEQTGGESHSSPVTPLHAGGGGREQNTNQVDVHRSAVEAVCGSETPAISSLFDTSGFEQGSSPYDAEAA